MEYLFKDITSFKIIAKSKVRFRFNGDKIRIYKEGNKNPYTQQLRLITIPKHNIDDLTITRISDDTFEFQSNNYNLYNLFDDKYM